MITTVMLVQRFATKTLYTRARATDGSTMLAPMSLGAGKGLINPPDWFLDQFSTRNRMVIFPSSHSHVLTMFCNDSYLTAL